MRETSQTPQIATPSNKGTFLLKETRVDTKSFFEINGEERAVLPSDIVNTLDFDGSDNNRRENRTFHGWYMDKVVHKTLSIPPQHPQRRHMAFYGR